ncbi:Dynein light chain Tctex-type [Novymonas esmeraldas]|uniref:Dynein light chain Tctex-type n=1 Tax=Novymonas esmeraldas TaxID=1808958 RepID=A0AAW0ET84_9TRYP
MADHGSGNSSPAATMNEELDATRAGAVGGASTLGGSSSAGDASHNATMSGQSEMEDPQAATTTTADAQAAAEEDGSEAAATTTRSAVDAKAQTVSGGGGGYDDDVEDEDEDGGAEGEEGEEGDAGQWERVAASDVKNIILQALSPYFDDDAGGGAAVVPGVDLAPPPPSSSGPGGAGKSSPAVPGSQRSAAAVDDDRGAEDTAQRYDHFKSEEWIALVCDGIMERLVALGKPFKFVVHAMVMRKCGAGVHVCSSCYYAPTDGWLSHAHDLSAHLYAVVTVYWCAV